MRHIFASRLAMAGHNEGISAALLRHSSTALVKRYVHLSPLHLHAAVEIVSHFRWCKPTKTSQFQTDRDRNRNGGFGWRGERCRSG